MENASKALIIAGAILISILLISVGVLIMNSTGNTQASVEDNANQIAKRTFNSNFTPYEGENQSASQIRALRSAVEASNASSEKQVTLDMTGVSLTSSGKYKVTITAYADGYVSAIKVETQAKKP